MRTQKLLLIFGLSLGSSLNAGKWSECKKRIRESLIVKKVIASKKTPKAIIIVDPFGHNAGELIHKYALAKGIEPIFVFSSPLKKWPPNYHHFAKLAEKYAVIEHDGYSRITLAKIQAKAKERGVEISGALPGLEGHAVQLFDEISSALKLPSNGTKLSDARTGKAATQKQLKNKNLAYISKEHIQMNDPHLMEKAIRFSTKLWGLGKTVILKPNSGAATTYIFKCRNESDLRNAYEKMKAHPYFLHRKIESFNLEEKLIGPEYIYDTVRTTTLKDGKEQTLSVLVGVWKYNRAPSADPMQTDVIDSVEWIPADHVPKGLREYGEAALNALDIRYGPTHLEIFHTADGFRLVDFNARLPGSSPLISSEATGNTRNQIEMAVESVTDPYAFVKKYTYRQHPMHYTTAKHALVLHLNVYEKGHRANLSRLAQLKARFPNVIFESKIFPQDMNKDLPLTVDLFTPLIKLHLLGSKEEIEEVVAIIRKEHQNGDYYID